ncbi:hypothetical protein BBK14_01385 [Parafrankia soli]|uniref:Uncharacterized protein n=1 Tax=Parafrankia soli TaxID=2599596 RepID=A0A1S1RQ58_9ACTN|nr:hypothetical protein BBK14_01385 [Parafrankia soli]
MDDPELVGGTDAVEDLARRGHGLQRGQGAAVADLPAQVGSVDEVHDDRELPALGHKVVHPHRVGRVEPAQDGALTQEAGDELLVGRQLGAQHLEGEHGPVVGAAAPHLTHGAAADQGIQRVRTTEALGQCPVPCSSCRQPRPRP